MTPEVRSALDELIRAHGADAVAHADDREGGVFVIIEGVPLGAPYAQTDTWIGFHITASCPYADVYPHFVRPDITRADGNPLGEGMSENHEFPTRDALKIPGALKPRSAVQVSRRSNHRDASGIESPYLKLLKVMRWMLSR